ncbi:hypothetical protein MUP77_16625 [Candidatus Bathyarchaeota archaeon]|nr:hypothetical protein [Candidatus Bathyarchaeota archaeon]
MNETETSMNKTEASLRVIYALIENGYLKSDSIGAIAKLPEREIANVLRDLQFLDFIVIKNSRVYLSSQVYSVLFDAVSASRGLEKYVGQHFDGNVVKETRAIPALLVPLLLLRAASPYIGLILQDLEKKGKIQIARNKEELLLDYFSRRPIDYKPTKNWKEIDFEPEEFYDLWIALNEELSKRIDTSSGLFETLGKTESLGDFGKTSKSSKESKFGTLIKKAEESIPSNLKMLKAVRISMQNMLAFIHARKNATTGLVITNYGNALKWEFTGEKIAVPPMFLLEDGIYIEPRFAGRFSKRVIFNQVNYLEDCIGISENLHETGDRTRRSKQDDVGFRRTST